MTQFFLATFEDGVLKPHEPLGLLPHSQVRVAIEPVEDAEVFSERQKAWENLERLWSQTAIDSDGGRLTRDQLHERR